MKATILAVLMAATLIGCGGYKANQSNPDCRKSTYLPDKAQVSGDITNNCGNTTVIQPTTVYKEVPVEVEKIVYVDREVIVEVPVEVEVPVRVEVPVEKVVYRTSTSLPTNTKEFIQECMNGGRRAFDYCHPWENAETWWGFCFDERKVHGYFYKNGSFHHFMGRDEVERAVKYVSDRDHFGAYEKGDMCRKFLHLVAKKYGVKS